MPPRPHAAPQLVYDLSYSAADRPRGSEVMFFGPGLRLPEIRSAANISRGLVDEARMASFMDGA